MFSVTLSAIVGPWLFLLEIAPQAPSGLRTGGLHGVGLQHLPEVALPLGRSHPLAFELHEATSAIGLLLGNPPPVELDLTERAVRLLVVRQDREHLGVGLGRLA